MIHAERSGVVQGDRATEAEERLAKKPVPHSQPTAASVGVLMRRSPDRWESSRER